MSAPSSSPEAAAAASGAVPAASPTEGTVRRYDADAESGSGGSVGSTAVQRDEATDKDDVQLVETGKAASPAEGGDDQVAGSGEAQAATTKAEPPNPPHWRTNIGLLILAWTLGYTVQFMHIAGTVAIAKEMAGANLATLPSALIFVGALLSTMPLALLGEKKGLKFSYVVGTACGLIGGTLCLLAILYWSYPLLCFGLLFQGTQQATTQLLRFGVRTVSPPKYMSKALSYIVAGAAIAAPIGPIATQYSVWLVPSVKYLGIYIIIDALIVAMSLVCMCLRFPPPAEKPKPQGAGGAAPEPEISRWKIMGYFLSNKRFLIAMIAGMTSYAVMVLMMAPAPLAIVGAGFTFADQANVIMAHVLGMFVPSLFTGWLIDRFGSITMNIIGMVILTAAIAILFGGEILPIFYVGETLVGVGWNFSFIASTSIIVKGAKPGRELQTVQGYNDSFIQLLAGVVVLISGPLYQAIHWLPLAGLALCLIGLAAIAILAVARLPIRGLRDGGMSAMDYKPQTDDVQLYDREEQKENEQRENEAQK